MEHFLHIRKIVIARIFLLFFVWSYSANAEVLPSHGRIVTTSLATIAVPDTISALVTATAADSALTFNDVKVINRITVGINHDISNFDSTSHSFQIYFHALYDSSGTAAYRGLSAQLNYNFKPGSAPSFDQQIFEFEGYNSLDISLDSVLDNGSLVSVFDSVLYIDGDIFVERYYQFPTDTLTLNAPNIQDFDCDGIPDGLKISWPLVFGIEEYQLEWNFINDYDATANSPMPATPTYLDPADIDFDFHFNSTRITTREQEYTIPLLFEHGYILYRLRGIGRDYTNPQHLITGEWNSPDASAVVDATHSFLVDLPHEANKNWQLSSTFAEEGKRKDVLVYADGTSRARQTVTMLNTDSAIVVGETIYDIQGRPAVNILPVPADSGCAMSPSRTLKYYANFNISKVTGNKFSTIDFDFDSVGNNCSILVNGLDSIIGASNYYSGLNRNMSDWQGLVPNAKGYPFTQTEYTPDNTGRIRRQGGVGPVHQLGSNHETKYLYGQPNQIQLDRLFGSEVGDVSHYKKNVVIDANGQASVSYLNLEGKVIATALAGDALVDSLGHVILQPLASMDSAQKTFVVDLLGKDARGESRLNNVNISRDAIVFNSQLIVPTRTIHTINYTLMVAPFQDSCMNSTICFNCIYDLEIRVKNDCGEYIASTSDINPVEKKVGHFTTVNDTVIFGLDCDTLFETDELQIDLPPGNYTVSKILSIDTTARRTYVDSFLTAHINNCFYSLDHFQQLELDGLDTTCCYIDCISCLANLGTKENFVASGRGEDYQYDYLYEQCSKPCRPITDCETSYDGMLVDMTRDGQYAEYNFEGSIDPSKYPLSIFNYQNYLPRNISVVGNATWKHPQISINGNSYQYYIDEAGNRSKVYLVQIDSTNYIPKVDSLGPNWIKYDPETGFYTFPENLHNVSDFISRFQNSWASSLVIYHPEYCYYEVCKQTGIRQGNDTISSDEFDNILISTDTYQEALDLGLLEAPTPGDPAVPADYLSAGQTWSDPFLYNASIYNDFSPGFDLWSKFYNRYHSYVWADSAMRSIEEMAAATVRCGYNTYAFAGPSWDCFAYGESMYNGSIWNAAHLNDSILNKEWVTFRSLYLSIKKNLLRKIQHSYAINECNGYNGCIGKEHFNPFNAGISNFSVWNSIYNSAVQPCNYRGIINGYYVHKNKRFNDESDIEHADENTANSQYYQQTGQCPMAVDFQLFLNSLAERGGLIESSPVLLKFYPEFTSDLAAYLFNPQNLAHTDSLSWESDTITDSPNLIGKIVNVVSNAVLCTIHITGDASFSWGNLTGFRRVEYTGTTSGQSEFNVIGFHSSMNPTTHVMEFQQFPTSGSTCFKLGPCEFMDVCEPNQLALDLSMLMSMIAYSDQLLATSSSPLDLSVSPYVQYVTPRIQNAAHSSDQNLVWYNDLGNNFVLYNPADPDYKLHVEFESFVPSGFSSSMASIHGFSQLTRKSKYLSSFVVNGLDSAGAQIVTGEGRISLINHGNGSKLVLSMGECGPPVGMDCMGTPYETRNDLEVLFRDILIAQADSDTINISISPYFSSLLRSILPDYYFGTTTYSSNTTIGGGSVDSIVFSFLPDSVNCNLFLIQRDQNGDPLHFNDIIDVHNLTGTEPRDPYDNYFGFYFIADFDVSGAIVSDTIWGQSCFPLKNCEHCDEDSFPSSNRLISSSGSGSNQYNAIPKIKGPDKSEVEHILNNYLLYRKSIAGFNLRYHLRAGDQYFLEPVSILKFNSIVKRGDCLNYRLFLESSKKSQAIDIEKFYTGSNFKETVHEISSSLFIPVSGPKQDSPTIENTPRKNKNLPSYKSLIKNKTGSTNEKISSPEDIKGSNTVDLDSSVHGQGMLFISPEQKITRGSNLPGGYLPISCTLLNQALDDYNNLTGGIYPPLTMWMNSYFGMNHSYSYWYSQITGCSLTIPTVGPSCIDFDSKIQSEIASLGLSGFVASMNTILGWNFTTAEYVEWMDSCNVISVDCTVLQSYFTDYQAINSDERPPLTVYLNSVSGGLFTYAEWATIAEICNLTLPSSSFACESLDYYYLLYASEGTGDIAALLNTQFGLSFVWQDYKLWLDSCNMPYIDCDNLQAAINSYQSLDEYSRPPMVFWLNHYLGLEFNLASYLTWLDRCDISVPEKIDGDCDSLLFYYNQCTIGPLNQLASCLNSHLSFGLSLSEYLEWMSLCSGTLINCDSLASWYSTYNALNPKPPFVPYMNTLLGVSLTIHDYLALFHDCSLMDPVINPSCDTLETIYNICATSYMPFALSDCFNSFFGLNYSIEFYYNWLDSCQISHDRFNCETFEAALGEFPCLQDTMTTTEWLNYYFAATHTESYYDAYLDTCKLKLDCCTDLNTALNEFPCDSNLSVREYLNAYFEVNFSLSFWMFRMNDCGMYVACDTCTRLTHLVEKYMCQDTLSIYDYLAGETGYILNHSQWDSLLESCEIEIPCHFSCDQLNSAISSYDCNDSLVDYLNNYFGYLYTWPTWATYLDSCHVVIQCINCDSLTSVVSDYDCTTDGPIESWLNTELGWTLTYEEYIYQFSMCNIILSCDTCEMLDKYIYYRPCDTTLTIPNYLNSLTHLNYTDSVWIALLDSCGVKWHNCINCTGIQSHASDYPCNSPIPFWSWMNTDMNVNFTAFEWNAILDSCPVAGCDSCSLLDSLVTNYDCQGTFTWLQWIYNQANWTLSDPQFIGMIHRCGLDTLWMSQCLPDCDSLNLLVDTYPCNSGTPLWSWLNQQLDVSLSSYEWNYVYTFCPLSGCDSCSFLDSLVYTYPCHDSLSLTQYLDTTSYWNLPDSNYLNLLIGCNLIDEVIDHCFYSCDSLQFITSLYPCDTNLSLASWINSAYGYSFSESEWTSIFNVCPPDTVHCVCSYLDSLISTYPCHDTLSLTEYLNSITHYNWIDSVYIQTLHDCGLDSIWIYHCIGSCDSLLTMEQGLPCNNEIAPFVWLNSVMNFSYSREEWDAILLECPLDTSVCTCNLLDSLIDDYSCHGLLSLGQYLDSITGYVWSDSVYIGYLENCGLDSAWAFHCFTCDSLQQVSASYPCHSGIPLTNWLNDTLNLSYSELEWSAIIRLCPIDTARCTCNLFDSLISTYNCHDSLSFTEYLDSITQYGWSDTTYITLLDSCGLDSSWAFHCYTCDSLQIIALDYPCHSGIPLTTWLNDTLQLSYSAMEWSTILSLCPLDTAHCTCEILDSLISSYDCHDTLSFTQFLDSITQFGWSDTTYITLLDSCGLDSTWAFHCYSCDSLLAVASGYPCQSGIPLITWLNNTLDLSYSEFEWTTILSLCPMDTNHCTCELLDSLIATYDCHDTLSFTQYLDSITQNGWSDTTYISLLDSCGLDSTWAFHCFTCDSVQDVAGAYPCHSGIPLTTWLNDTLDLSYSEIEWSTILALCPMDTNHCTCPLLDSLVSSYECHDSLSLVEYLDLMTQFGWTDTMYMSQLDSCGLDSAWMFHCVVCDSLQLTGLSYPCNNGTPLTTWLNDTLYLAYSDYEWSIILQHCPIDTSECPCIAMDSLISLYPCHDSLSLADYLEGILNYGWSDSTYLVQLDSCGLDSIWVHHCIDCDSLQMVASQYPCGSSMSFTAWLNDQLDFSFTNDEWNTIFQVCNVDSTCMPIDSCVIFYQAYISTYHDFVVLQDSVPTCPDYEIDSPLYTYQDFVDHNLCCSDTGYVLYAEYISSFISVPPCPESIPTSDTCSVIEEYGCDSLYHEYLTTIGAYNVSPFALAHNHVLDPGLFLSGNEFEASGFCGCAALYIVDLQSYLIALPTDSLPLPLPIVSSPLCDSSDNCLALYNSLNQTITNYNNSDFALTNQDSLAYPFTSYYSFLLFDYCNCTESYIQYLDTFIALPDTAVRDSAVTIFAYQGCGNDTLVPGDGLCSITYASYQEAVVKYNQYVSTHAVPSGTPLITTLAASTEFTSYGYCYCVENYINFLASLRIAVLSTNTPPSSDQISDLDIANFCDGTPYCADEFSDIMYSDTLVYLDSNMVNPCAQQLMDIALQNAWIEYNNYLDSLRINIGEKYTEHCLKAFETFTDSSLDKEFHFTLYYYDQAGNLVKTVPPEGLTILPITRYYDPLEQQIINDRTYGKQTVFTEHVMPTIYEYNSLNQLTKQSLPDHNLMDIWDYKFPSGLNNELNVTSTQFVTPNKGYLTGYVMNGSAKRGYLYTSNDAGNSWTRMNDLVAADFNKVQMISSTVGYAVGNEGVMVKTNDGGNSWDLINTYKFPATTNDIILHNLRDLYMQDLGSGTFEGYVVGDSGAVFKITDVSGTVSIVALSASLSKMYTSITYNGSDFYAAGRDTSGEGFICTISGTTITDVSNLSTTAMRSVCFVSNDALYPGYAFAVGDDGHLLKSLDGGSTWKEVKTGLTKNFANVYFRTDLIGLALIDSADGNNQMFKTADGGLSWTLMGSKGEYYHSMHFESDETGIAVGKNGLIKRIIVNSNGYEPYFGLIAVREPENPATKQEYTAVSSTMVPLSSTDTAIFACVVRADGKFFGTKDLGAGTVQWRDLDVITPTDLPVRQIGLKIEKETISSQDYYLFRVPFATSLNYPLALIEKVVSGTVNASTVDVPFTFGVRKLYNITNSPLTNEIYALGRINIAGGSNIQLYRIEMSDVPTIPTLSCTPKSTGSSTFDGINEPTCLAIDSSDNVLVSSADLHTILTKSDAPIGTSPISFTDKSWTVTPLAITDIESYGSSNHMVASGEDGTMYSTYSITSGLGFSADLSYCSAKLNAIRMDGSGDGIVAGDSGKVFRFVHTTGLFELDPVMSGTIKNLNDIAFTTGSAISYISGDAGTLLKIPVTGSVDRVHSLMPSPLNVNYYGLTFKSGSSTELQVVGTHSGIYYYTGSNGMKVKDVFVHGLQDVNFRNSNEGFAVGEDGIIRHTINAGSTWDVILPEFNSSDELPEYKSVWNTGPEQLVLAGSGNYLSQIENGALNAFATHDYSSSNSNVWNDIKFNEHAVGFSVCSDGDALEFSYSESTNAVSIVGTHSDSASISFNALHIFDDNSFIAVGPSNTIRYYNGSGFINQKGNITASGNNYNDVFFHDDRNGYVVGDGGLIYRTSALCNIQGLGGNGLKWYKRTDEDQFVIRDVDTADVDIKVIAFPGRYNGWVAGSYSRNNESYRGTTYPYGRLLHDESLLYSTTFWYDRVGRLVLSQNTKQYNVTPKRFSYTLYDKLGRIHEVGEKDENVSNIFFPEIFGEYVNNYFNPKVLNDSSMSVWIGETSGARREVTKTFYDVPSIPVYPYLCDQSTTYSFDQENLRNRVASVTYQEIYDGDSTIFDYGTHYSYDIHGNVKSLLQDNQKFALDYSLDQQRFKKIDYDYDLISGKVNSVKMQKDQPDQFIHEYQYDADNRITHVYTSKDGIQFDNDASYFYYLHGPLARMELGKDKVQGVDYAYTLQGWIKGVNSNLGSPGNDIGMDGYSGTSNEFVARDAYGYTLNYYEGDYEPINTHRSIPADSSFEMKTAGSDVWANRSDLFNGNISMMATTIAEPISSNNQVLAPLPQANAYRYDQLNRLLESRSFDNFNSSTNTWGSGSSYADRYFNQFSYDANGNIINQLRDSLTGDKIDEFHYLYDSATTCGNVSTYRKVNNRLMHVVNTAGGSPDSMHFEYDDIGNLVEDSEAEIDTIYWTVSGKIKQIMRQSGSTMQGLIFEYDPMGNRIAKHVYNASGPLEFSTYYLRDAQGNILATYQFTDTSGVPSFTLREENLYGSSRLGIRKDSIELIGATSVCNLGTSTNLLGLKQFELSNHLGNVLSVVSDRKLPYNSSGTGSITSYQPEILNATDYYPFGMGMGGRNFTNPDNYRFGFNGKECDIESFGQGDQMDYGMRIYSTRLARFLSVDPIWKDFPWLTLYQFAGNKPVWAVDLDGLEEKIITPNGFEIKATYAATIEVVDNIDIETLQQEVNLLFNNNPTNQKHDNGFTGPQEPSVQFNIQIVLENEMDNDLSNLAKSRIATANGQSLGGRIIMGKDNDPGFIKVDKDGIPSEGVIPAYTKGSTIYLNPRVYDKKRTDLIDMKKYQSNQYTDIGHEIGHDLGLNHEEGVYPEKGIMSNTWDKDPTREEINNILDEKNKNILQPGEKYTPENK